MGARKPEQQGAGGMHAVHAGVARVCLERCAMPGSLSCHAVPRVTCVTLLYQVQCHPAGASDATTLSQILKATSDQQPSSLLHLTVVGVLQASDDGSTAAAAAAAAAASRTAAQPCAQQQAVMLLLLHDASLQDSGQSVQHYVHSTLRSLFSGPNACLGTGKRASALLTPTTWVTCCRVCGVDVHRAPCH